MKDLGVADLSAWSDPVVAPGDTFPPYGENQVTLPERYKGYKIYSYRVQILLLEVEVDTNEEDPGDESLVWLDCDE